VAWHALTKEECLDKMRVSLDSGIDQAEAAKRLIKYGANELIASPRPPIWAMILEQFEDRLVQILLCVALVSAVLSMFEDNPHAFIEPLAILTILVLNAAVGVWQGQSAEGALEALKKLQPSTASVLREGVWQSELPARELVPGDIIQLRVGDKVPADARVLKTLSSTLSVDECSLTGESVTVSKSPAPVEEDAVIQGKTNMVFAGTLITIGSVYAVVTGTAMSTEMGKIQSGVEQAKQEEAKTPLMEKLDEFGAQLSWIIGAICLGVWLIKIPAFTDPAHGGTFKGAVHFAKVAVALGVAAIPEGLPAVITLCLSLGTRRMAKRNVIVRKLRSVETLGCTTVICTDKTGTLTTNQMTAVSLVNCEEMADGILAVVEHPIEGVNYCPAGVVQGVDCAAVKGEGLQAALNCAGLCNDAAIFKEDDLFKHSGEPTEAALKVLAEKLVTAELGPCDASNECDRASSLLNSKWRRLATLEFDRNRKSMGVLSRDDEVGENRLYVKGAAEVLLTRCTKVMTAAGAVPLSDAFRAELLEQIQDMAVRPLRCIALAIKEGGDLQDELTSWDGTGERPPLMQDPECFTSVESELTLVGVVGIKDPARPEVPSAIKQCTAAGIRIMMITGDSKATAVSIARDVNILSDEQISSGQACAFTGLEFFTEMDETAQLEILSRGENLVFCRTQPMDKQKLIRMLQFQNEVPAMTGDGVNDAPALQQAAIGVAMGITGTEVSKEASDMILADDNFATIVAAVEEGRCIYNNMQAFICFLISCNLGEIATVFFSTLIGLPDPLTPLQLLWVNLVTDGPPATALGFNPPDPMAMSKPPRNRSSPIMSKWLLTRFMLTGLYVGAATIGITVWWYLDNGVMPGQLRRWGSCADFYPPPLVGSFCPSGLDLVAEPELFDVMNPCSIFGGRAKMKVQTLALSTLVCMEMLKALSAVSVDSSILITPPWKNPALIIGCAVPFLLHLAVLKIPSMGTIFGLVPLTGKDWYRIAVCAIPVVLVEEILKATGRYLDYTSRIDNNENNHNNNNKNTAVGGVTSEEKEEEGPSSSTE